MIFLLDRFSLEVLRRWLHAVLMKTLANDEPSKLQCRLDALMHQTVVRYWKLSRVKVFPLRKLLFASHIVNLCEYQHIAIHGLNPKKYNLYVQAESSLKTSLVGISWHKLIQKGIFRNIRLLIASKPAPSKLSFKATPIQELNGNFRSNFNGTHCGFRSQTKSREVFIRTAVFISLWTPTGKSRQKWKLRKNFVVRLWKSRVCHQVLRWWWGRCSIWGCPRTWRFFNPLRRSSAPTLKAFTARFVPWWLLRSSSVSCLCRTSAQIVRRSCGSRGNRFDWLFQYLFWWAVGVKLCQRSCGRSGLALSSARWLYSFTTSPTFCRSSAFCGWRERGLLW